MLTSWNGAFLRNSVVFVVALFGCVNFTYGTCNFPSELVGTWHDSRHGTTTIGNTQLTGLIAYLDTYGALSTWDCRVETFATNGRILLRAPSSVTILFQPWYFHICIEFTQVTADSYIYYRLNAREEQASDARLLGVIGTDDNAVDMSNACDATFGGPATEFAMLIRSGSESNAYRECPLPLLGRFDITLTDAGGTTHCNDPNNPEHLNVCSDKTQFQFDTACSESPVFAPGNVYCVYDLTSGGDTFIQLYNPGASDNSTTHTFSCMAISSDSTSATVVYRNCTNEMTSTTPAVDKFGTTIGLTITFSPYVFCQGGCTWPSPFANTVWKDNTRGTLTFGGDTLTGWSLSILGSSVANWECLDMSFFASEQVLLIKSTDTFFHLSSYWTTYLCLKMTQVTSNSYTYYQNTAQDATGNYERAIFSTDGTITAKSSICTAALTNEEFHFMVKTGEEEASIQECASSLLAQFDYTVTMASDSSVSCDTSTDDWDVCTNTSMMAFDYSLCGTTMAYSSSGLVYCMATKSSGGIDFTVVYNTDSSPTEQFACIASNSGGSAASFIAGNCTKGQTPTGYALDADGVAIGYKTTMTKTASCPGNSGASSEEGGGSSMLPMIIGAVVGILLILIILFLIYWFCYRKKKFCFKKKDVGHSDDNRNGAPRAHTPVLNPNPNKPPPVSPAVEPDMSVPLPNAPPKSIDTPRTMPSISN